jgi:hypothetical protein
MAPQYIDDLPRHEEPRQLMLGLIDDLPQERRDTRQLMMWGWLGLTVVLFVVLVWVTAPNGPPGSTARPRPSPENGMLANQGSGESQAGQNNMVTPRENSAVGSGQNASGEAAQIEQTATPLNLSDAQRQQIRQYFASKPGQRMQSANFSLAVGAAVPQDVPLQKLPPEISSVMGGYQSNDYVLVGDQLVIVDPSARRVVARVPQIS